MSRLHHGQEVGGGITATKWSGRFAAIASDMKAFRKIVPNLDRTGRSSFCSTTNNSAPPRNLAVRPPREPVTKPTNGNANLQRPNGSGCYVLDQKQKTQCASRRFSSGFGCTDEEEFPYLSPVTKALKPTPTPPSKSNTHCTTTHENSSFARETDNDAEEEDEDDEDDESGEEDDDDEDNDDDGDEEEDEEEDNNDDDENDDGDDAARSQSKVR
ncbi:hypothetical protein SPBR_03233 [Sporothrix brasiliensis 5110]|uniref:Uncharacterized protein n=1 Tax=Sporothrix brasiliensis 5110 TaxID=1398154 RepID=A0A0C2FPJ2_9PEZI|nr:uncharacterized protein SPBR_03233 [Sporothrix brasiliensis 5110]KIH92983.1 hypothetical protein SPBR_03233 [Sporothrix brasiliensis 5110]